MDDTVFVGQKGVFPYALAIVTLMRKGAPTVFVKARGKAVWRAQAAAQIACMLSGARVISTISSSHKFRDDALVTGVTIEIGGIN